MKNILLYVHDDEGAEARLQVALDLARAHNAHLSCLYATPLTAYVASDIFGGVFVLPDLMDAVNKQESRVRAELEARLSRENVSWSYEQLDGEPAAAIVARSSLADAVVLSRCTRLPKRNEPEPLAGDVAVHTSAPVLAVPPDAKRFDACGAAVVAWNGSIEAANALKAAMPMLRQAASITLVAIDEDEQATLPASEACAYLSRHGLKPQLHEIVGKGGSVGDQLLDALSEMDAAYLVMGAFGHSRAREFLLGGVTRQMLTECPVPILLTH